MLLEEAVYQEKTLCKSLASLTKQGNIKDMESNSHELVVIDTECIVENKFSYYTII